jgi:hypothetical protein
LFAPALEGRLVLAPFGLESPQRKHARSGRFWVSMALTHLRDARFNTRLGSIAYRLVTA